VIFALSRRRPAIAARPAAELSAKTRLIVPAAAMFELEYGIAKSERGPQSRIPLDAFLSNGFEFAPFDAPDAREAGGIRAALERDRPVRLFDRSAGAPTRRDAGHREQARIRARAGADRHGLGGRMRTEAPSLA
jgi:tRNA(fMet)-specific endonuclease VapC